MSRLQHILNSIGILCLTVCASCMLYSCGDDDTYSPAPQIPDTNPGVYFPSSNSSTILRGEDEAKVITVTLQRTNTTGKLIVPITVVSKSSDVVIADSAVFADGAATTTINCTYEDLDKSPEFEIAVSEDYGNPYLMKDGSTHYSANVYKLNTISNTIEVTPYTASSKDLFANVTNQGIYQLGHENHFIWKNFLGSGVDLEFKIDGTFNSEDLTKCHGSVLPLNHNWDDDYGWYLMTEASPADYPDDDSACAKWTPEGSSTYIGGYMYFYRKYSGTEYFYIDFGKISSTTDGETSNYSYGWITSAIVSENGRGTTEKEIKTYNTYYYYLYY